LVGGSYIIGEVILMSLPPFNVLLVIVYLLSVIDLFFLFVNIFYAVAHHINPLPDYSNHPKILEEFLPTLWRIELIFYVIPCTIV